MRSSSGTSRTSRRPTSTCGWWSRRRICLTEFVQDHWPFGRHAISIGLNGGGFRFGHEEYRDGSYQAEESFWGHGAEMPLSYYAGTKLFDKLPLQGQLRLTPAYVVYQKSFDTDDRFVLPPDTGLLTGRAGLRLGGVPPELLPRIALEASAWYEATWRSNTEHVRAPRAAGAAGVAHAAGLGPSGRRVRAR